MLFGFPWTFFAELLALGAAGGLLAGLLGVGGGMILVPFTTLLLAGRGIAPELTLKMAVATSLATICFTGLSSVRAHRRRGALRMDIVRQLSPGIVVGALVGAQLAKLLPGAALSVVFGGFLALMATQMLFDLRPAARRALPGRAGMAATGGLIGSVSSLVGAGGAFLSVPFMAWCNVAMHQAVGTASAIGLPIALAGTLGFVIAGWADPRLPAGALGFVHLPALTALATASVLTAPLGAAAAHRLNVRQLRRVFALLLYAVSATMLLRG